MEEELIKKYELLIFKIAKKFYNVEIHDLYQAGCIGLIKASRKYDATIGGSFIDFAYKYIFGEMYELANKSRDIKLNKAYLSIYKKIEQTKKELTDLNNVPPSISEISAYLEIDEKIINDVIVLTKQMLSLDDEYQTNMGGVVSLEECIGKSDNIDDKILINDSLETLEPLEADVIKIRYFSDLTQMETASVLGISQVKVSRLEEKGKQKIKKYIVS